MAYVLQLVCWPVLKVTTAPARLPRVKFPLLLTGAMPETHGMHYIGLMSGTSVDGIDAVLVSIAGPGRFNILATHQHRFPVQIRTAIQSLMPPGDNELERAGELDMQLGQLFAEAVHMLLEKSGKTAQDIRAIGSHGQTIRHRPRAAHPFTRQIGNPSVIAEATGITTVADFRARDMAAGGEGAPLVPAFHADVFRQSDMHRVIINIGGIANVTALPGDANQAVIGFDTGPGNTLLDQWIARHHDRTHDANGEWAAGGRVIKNLLERFLQDPYFAAPPPKSTGREYFNIEWLEQCLRGTEPAQDVQSTLAQLTADSIAKAVEQHLPHSVDEIYVCGGGTHNLDLMARLGKRFKPVPVETTAALGIDPDWIEAAAFAWLAHQTLEQRPGNLPSVTGARRPVILGGIYPASL